MYFEMLTILRDDVVSEEGRSLGNLHYIIYQCTDNLCATQVAPSAFLVSIRKVNIRRTLKSEMKMKMKTMASSQRPSSYGQAILRPSTIYLYIQVTKHTRRERRERRKAAVLVSKIAGNEG